MASAASNSLRWPLTASEAKSEARFGISTKVSLRRAVQKTCLWQWPERPQNGLHNYQWPPEASEAKSEARFGLSAEYYLKWHH